MDDRTRRRFEQLRTPRAPDECWLWRGAINEGGYGYLGVGERKPLAHRLSYEHAVGPIPDGLTIDHLCRVRSCVNPAHLEAVTLAENVRRSHAPGLRLTHPMADPIECRNGHLRTEENTVIRRGSRVCLVCARRRNREHWQRKAGRPA